jgi:GAF domain-containing protein
MRRGESRAKGSNRGARTRAGTTKTKTRAGRNDASSAASAKKRPELKKTAKPEALTNRHESTAGLRRSLAEAYRREAVTADVLKVISRSGFDLQQVLDTLVESACRLCEAYDAMMLLREGDSLVLRAHHGPIPVDTVKRPITRAWTSGRAVVDRVPVHVPDLVIAETEFPESHAISQRTGTGAMLSVPLLRENEAIGALSIRRTEVRPFSAKQIELATTFADQAVIAIENARLFDEVQARTREAQESLEYQTAISDVLNVISRSPAQIGPVLDVIAETAQRLCRSEQVFIFQLADGMACLAAGAKILTLPDFTSSSSTTPRTPPA